MELKFSKKARKVVASLLAVAILFGILPVSGLTSVSTSDEIDNSEDSAKTIYVKSDDYQPVLFDKDGKFKGIIPESDKENVYITKAVEGDNIALFDDKNISKDDSVVFYENTNDWSTPYAYLWQDDSSHNAKWHSEAMTKCSDDTNLYYYVYPSKSFSYVIFNDNGSEQTGDNNLNDWYVYSYSKNGENGKSVYDSLIHCEVGDANIYEQSESKLESKNISEPQGMGAIIKVADNEYTVCGVDAVDSIDCYEDDDIYGFTANAVDGYTAEATGEEDNNKIKYSVTYTNDTYGMQFFVENEVTFNKSPRLKVDGEFKVDFNGKSDYKNNDIIYNLTGEVKDLKASFEPSVYFEGETITEGYEVSITLNGKEFTSSCKSTDLTKGLNKGDNKGNKLVATVSYDNYSVKSEFSFDYVECDVTLSKLDYDNNVYIKNNDIYSNGTGNVELLLNTGSDDIDKNKLEFKLYKCDASPDSKEEIEDAIGFDKDNSIIKIYKQKLSEAKSANLEITSKDYNLSKTYTISYDTISKDNFKYSNTNENNERYYVNADTGVNVTFQLDGIDATLFNNESTKVECNDVNVKPEFDASNKVWKAKIKKSASYKFTFENNEFKQEVSLDATDLYLDDTAPEIKSFKFEDGSSAGNKLLSFLTFGIYHNEEINVTVTAEDPEVDGVSSGIDNWKEENHAEIQLYSTENQEKITAGDYNYSDKDGLSRTFTLACGEKESNQYMLTAKAWDNVHNGSVSYTFEKPEAAKYSSSDKLTAKLSDSADTDVVTNTIDPIVNSITSVAYGSDSVKHTDSKNKEWYSKNIEFSISVKDSNDDNYHTGIKEVTAEFNKNDVSDRLTGLPDDFTTKKVESVDNITFNTDGLALKKGENTVEVTVVNNSGMSSAKEYGVYVDDTAPKIKSFKFEPTKTNNSNEKPTENKNTYGYYVNSETTVTVTAEDELSGVKEIHYRAVDLNGNIKQNGSRAVDTNNSIWFTVEPDFKGYIYAYAVDNVYNGSEEYHPDGLVVESGEMHAESSGITATLPNSSYSADGNPLYSGDITIPVTVTDSYSGIKKIEYSVKSDYDTQNNHSQEIELDNSVDVSSVDNWSVDKTDNNLVTQMSRNITVSNNSNDIVLTVKLTDRAGNETEIEKKFSIDKTKPTIDVEYDNNEHTTYGENDYYKADRTATVTVTERNFDESLVEAAIMRDGGGYTTIGGWTHNNNSADPDKSTHVATIVYNTDGDFTFDIAVKDKAMNSADEFTQHKFTVDKTAPEIEVSFDNNSSKNGNYYKADRTATIKITEHNFNSGSQYVTIPVTADGATAPSVVGWSDSGDNHNATVSFNKDGKYSFTVDYTDLAGNKAVQKTVDSFYIDKTAPEVEITGVEDHQAYNGTVAPIVTYKDDNFTDDHDFQFTKIDINNRSTDTSMFEYDTDGNGVTEFIYKYRDFAETVENDGIYNFTVELSDKAGNSTSKSVTFSVNRFGSTFMAYDESMKKLFNNGYTNAEQDIVIEEINVSPLTKHSVTLAKSGGKSSELVENSDYKFTSSSSNTEWSKSIYTVNKQNFSDEAEYTVTIMSVDKAKNTNNNRMADSSLSTKEKSERECSITFVVDKTSPLVSITGIKDNERYKEASKTVKIVCEDDNLDKTKLVVTLDDKTLAEGEDYTIVEDSDNSLAGMLTAEIVLKAARGGVEENLNVAIDDLAGNTGEKSIGNFILSANIFQRFFANPVLVICTFAGLALVIAAVIFFIAKKRKKAE